MSCPFKTEPWRELQLPLFLSWDPATRPTQRSFGQILGE